MPSYFIKRENWRVERDLGHLIYRLYKSADSSPSSHSYFHFLGLHAPLQSPGVVLILITGFHLLEITFEVDVIFIPIDEV